MKCKSCGSEWNAPQNISVSLSSCPFCGASLTPAAPKQFLTVEDVLTEITSRFGVDVLRNGQRTMALFSDLSPSLMRERLLLSYLIQSDGNIQLLQVRDKTEVEQQACFQKVCRYLVDEQFVAEEAAYKICTSFSTVIGLTVKTEPPKVPTPPAKPAAPKAAPAPKAVPTAKPATPAAAYSPIVDLFNQQAEKRRFSWNNPVANHDETIRLLTERAENGNWGSQARLAKWYRDGYLVEKDPKKAFYWYEKAAQSKDPEAVCNLGWCYIRGFGCTANPTKAVHYFQQAAKAGIPAAKYNLASCYERGHGIQKSLADAVALYEQAAKDDHTKAQYHLGRCYKDGIGLNKDIDLAIYWYKKSAQNGYAEAQYQLGELYEQGIGLDQDSDLAYHWYKKAADQGHAAAKKRLSPLAP